MTETKLYLKENVQWEPLVNQWIAWSHLLSPATAAMNLAHSHMKILESFIMAPAVHAAAVRNPAMMGGPFLDYPPKKVGDIRALLDRTRRDQGPLIELARALGDLNKLMLNEAKGHSLESLYAKVPDPLKGYVELTYDINNHPSFRLIEALLYASPYYREDSQSLVLSLIHSDKRPFMFSTPKMEDDDHLHLPIALGNEALDALAKMRETPLAFEDIASQLGVQPEQEALFRSFLTEQPQPPCTAYDGDEPRVRYLNHACVLIETRETSIMTDPILSYHYECEIPRYTFRDMPPVIDYVVLTHNHSDHVVLETLLQLRHKIRHVLVPKNSGGRLEDPSLKLQLQKLGFANVVELDEMEAVDIPGGSITSLPFLGEHCDLGIRSKNALWVNVQGASMLFAADSANLENALYQHIHRVTGDIDTLFIGMECDGAPLSWVYGALMMRPIDRGMDQSRRLSGSNFERARRIVAQLNCKRVYVYAMGMEPWLSHIMALQYTAQSPPIVESDKLIEDCRQRGIPAERLDSPRELRLA